MMWCTLCTPCCWKWGCSILKTLTRRDWIILQALIFLICASAAWISDWSSLSFPGSPRNGKSSGRGTEHQHFATALALCFQGRGYRSSPQSSSRSITVLSTAVEWFLPHLNNGLISAPLFKIAPFLTPSKPVKALSRVLCGLGGSIIYIRYGKIIQEREEIIPE